MRGNVVAGLIGVRFGLDAEHSNRLRLAEQGGDSGGVINEVCFPVSHGGAE